MKKILAILIAICICILILNCCYANPANFTSSADYLGADTTDIQLEFVNEYNLDYMDKLFDGDAGKLGDAEPSWCQITEDYELRRFKSIFEIDDLNNLNFKKNFYFVSFGAEIGKLGYWSNPKNYIHFAQERGYYPVLKTSSGFSKEKIYVYKMDTILLSYYGSCPSDVVSILHNRYSLTEDNLDEYKAVEVNLIKEGKLSKGYLYDYRYLRDKNNNLPQFGLYYQVCSQNRYNILKDRYGMPEFRYSNYKNKCIIISLGAKLKGFKIYNDRVEAIPTGEYVENECFVYEMDYCWDYDKMQGTFAVDEKTRDLMPSYLFE